MAKNEKLDIPITLLSDGTVEWDTSFGLEIETKSFSECLGDMYIPPDMIELSKVYNGAAGILQSVNRMNSYFETALGKFENKQNG